MLVCLIPMLKIQKIKKTPQKIIIVPDDNLEVLDNHTRRLQLRTNHYNDTVLINPHRHENRISTDILKFCLFCRRKNIRIVAYGSMNQLPFLGIFADEVILETNSQLAKEMYNDRSYTGNGVIGNVHSHSSAKFVNVERGWERRQAEGSISDDDVVENFASMNLYIRESSYNLFNELKEDLPKDCVWAEILSHPHVRHEMTKCKYHRPVIGLDRKFQQGLINAHHDHFMALQILTSLLNNVKFLCGGGSANLFVVVPIMAIAMIEQLLRPHVRNVYRKLAVKRYGQVGNTLPFMSGERAPTTPMEVWQGVDSLMDAMKAEVSFGKFRSRIFL